jgi:hypothetical protein
MNGVPGWKNPDLTDDEPDRKSSTPRESATPKEPKTISGGFGNSNRTNRRGGGGWGSK